MTEKTALDTKTLFTENFHWCQIILNKEKRIKLTYTDNCFPQWLPPAKHTNDHQSQSTQHVYPTRSKARDGYQGIQGRDSGILPSPPGVGECWQYFKGSKTGAFCLPAFMCLLWGRARPKGKNLDLFVDTWRDCLLSGTSVAEAQQG